jgi:serine/threonine-protein kinase
VPTQIASSGQGGAADAMLGRILNGRFRVGRKIGSGGFGAVHEGVQLQMDRAVALKILHPHMTRDPALVARFRQEARAACNLRDPHTIITYDFDQTEDGILYLAMELLTGRSLLAELQGQGAIGAARVTFLIDQIGSALSEAHAHGIVHRDIKPENIFIEDRESQRDHVKVLDFGIAKIMTGDASRGGAASLTASGQTLGTLEYMSPEQLAGGDLDGRSDIYSLGIMAYQMLTGALPFSGPPTAIITAHFQTTPPPPSRAKPGLPPAVDRVVMRCLAKEREHRYQDMGALRADLATLASELRGVAPVLQPPPIVVPAPAPASGTGRAGNPATGAAPGWAPLPHPGAAIPETRRAARPASAGSPPGRTGLYVGLMFLVMALVGGGGFAAHYFLTRPEAGSATGPGSPDSSLPSRGKLDAGVAVRWTVPGEKQPTPRVADAGAAPPQPGAPSFAGKSLETLVPKGCEAIAAVYPKRLFAVPGFRGGFESSLTPAIRAQLLQSNTRPAELEELLLLIPKIPAGAWRGEETKPEVAIAVRGVDGNKLRELFASIGGTVGGYRGVSWREQKDGALGVVGSDLAFFGHPAALRSAIDAAALGAGLDAEPRALKAAVSIGTPLAFGYLKLPGELPPQVQRKLGLKVPVSVDGLAVGLGHAEGVWSLRAALQTGSEAAATALRGKLNQTIEILRSQEELSRAGLSFLLQRIRSEVSERRLSISLSLNEEDLRKLIAAVPVIRGGTGKLEAPMPNLPAPRGKLPPPKRRIPFRQIQ